MEHVKIGILNLMQEKIPTNQNFEHILKDESVDLTFYYSATRYVDRVLDTRITETMKPLDLSEISQFDGFIITGSPVEKLNFEQVTYIQEINELLDKLNQLNIPQLYICWGAMAAMDHFYQIKKSILPHKTFGIYQNNITNDTYLLHNVSNEFPAPHARYAEMNHQDIADNSSLEINAVSENGLLTLVTSKIRPQVFIFSHLEYPQNGLDDEYKRELASGKVPNAFPARNYYSPIDKHPMFTWKETQIQFFSNWLNCIKDTKLIKS
ncbi:homoserine O-succinyltransferase [Companilactobacillus allii]|uniref:Serine O-acetyltransferase n=1 Tax=Companilactobacillus allii TaxID=1847728 RepID=A0A1P8Q333_9LACO|nr:homoserine O-succinyltransferase [Companilactobacillus allii]APX72237.1 homoserine O-succinyltransferase [Companilactobacillus allii]USQ69330.1 homoserine O-succinyltransferase [Companilactobacillus allii]